MFQNSFGSVENKKRKFIPVPKGDQHKLKKINLQNVENILKKLKEKKGKIFSCIFLVLHTLPVDILFIIEDYANTFQGLLVKKISHSLFLDFELNKHYLAQDFRIISTKFVKEETDGFCRKIIFEHSLMKFWFLLENNNTCNKIYFENGSSILLPRLQNWSYGTFPFHALILDYSNVIIWCQTIKLLWWINLSNLHLYDLGLDANHGFLNSIWKCEQYLFVAQGDFIYIFE